MAATIGPARRSRGAACRIITATVALLLAGCARRDAPAGAEGWPARLLATEDVPARQLAIAWQGSWYAEGGRAGSWLQRRIEERFNVALSVAFIPSFSYDKAIRFKLIGGEVPDVFWVASAREAARLAQQGFAVELPYEAIVKFAPDYVRLLREHAPAAWMLTYSDGRNIGLPTFNLSTRFPLNGVWNRTWLNRVGITKVPETLTEFEVALRKFHLEDPDRDGRRDTWGMATVKPGTAGAGDMSFQEIFGAHGIIINGWVERAGRLVWGGVLPEVRPVLALLRRWYAEGLIHPDYSTAPTGNLELRNQLLKGSVGYLLVWGYGTFNLENPHSVYSLFRGVHPNEELVPAWFPQGPTGARGVRIGGGLAGGIMMFGRQLAATPEKLVRVLRIFNEAARDEATYLELRIGREGLHWRWDPARGILKLPPYDQRATGAQELLGEGIGFDLGANHGYFIPFSASQKLVDRYTPPGQRAFRETYNRPEWGITDALAMPDIVPSAAKLLPHLAERQAQIFSAIITGHRPLEEFDAWVAEWPQLGGDVLTREANELYAQKQAILARVQQLWESAAGK
jgi:putative aldouronate transport system substrate-binding protein